MPDVVVSIVVPVYNGERYVSEAIDSVLAQSARDLEIVVVDDGSTDGSARVVSRFGSPVRYAYQPQSGIGATRNRGVALARGSLLGFVDADDRWADGRLALQRAVLTDRPQVDAVFGLTRQFVSPELPDEARRRVRCPEQAMSGYLPGAMLARRTLFDRVGPFRTDCRVGEFIDWCLRAREHAAEFVTLPEVVLWRRLHDANQGIRHRDSVTDYVHIVKGFLDRRRAAGVSDGSG